MPTGRRSFLLFPISNRTCLVYWEDVSSALNNFGKRLSTNVMLLISNPSFSNATVDTTVEMAQIHRLFCWHWGSTRIHFKLCGRRGRNRFPVWI
jgi:hypothetical protein